MNKKEVLEIRKQFTPENCAITRICGCYVDHEKEKKTELKKAFLSLPEEEVLAIFHVLKCIFLIFRDFQFSRHIPLRGR